MMRTRAMLALAALTLACVTRATQAQQAKKTTDTKAVDPTKLLSGLQLPGGNTLPGSGTVLGGLKLPGTGTTLPGLGTTLPTGTTLPGGNTLPTQTTTGKPSTTSATGPGNTGSGATNSGALPKFKINPDTVTVSGISSGGAMAVQLHVALSGVVKGSGVVAGIPFACASTKSATQCMSQGASISASALLGAAKTAQGTNGIDALGNLKTARVYMQGGTQDSVVSPATMAKVKEVYVAMGVPEAAIVLDNKIPSQHSWVTDNYGAKCNVLGSPYINNCGVDTTGDMLRHLLNVSHPRKPANKTRLFKISQKQFVPNDLPSAVSMDDNALIYVPQYCVVNECHLHVAIHGCAQGQAQIGTTFVSNIGMLEYAEANGLVILFPQAVASYYKPSNPQGCWDWFGYNTKSFYTKDAPQIAALGKMIAFLRQK